MTKLVLFLLFSYHLIILRCSTIRSASSSSSSSIVVGASAITFGNNDYDDAKIDNRAHRNFSVAGYLPDYRLRAYLDRQSKNSTANNRIGNAPPLTDLILFSLRPDAQGRFACCLQDDHFGIVEDFIVNGSGGSRKTPTRVWVTMGGGGRTAAFPDICASGRLRQQLIESILQKLKPIRSKTSTSTSTSTSSTSSKQQTTQHNSFVVGGIDLDFFQPRTIRERDNYLLLLTEAIPRWHQEGLKVSITLHPHQGRMIPPSVYRQLDRIHFVTYDMIGGNSNSNNNNNNYHASLDKVRQAVEELLQPGVGLETTPDKVLLGIPAYARHLRDPSRVKTFGEIYDDIRDSNNNDDNDDDDNNDNDDSSTAANKDDARRLRLHSWKGYEWDSPARIRAKVDLARQLKLGGIFFWELGQDKITAENPSGVLLESTSASVASSFSADGAAFRSRVRDEGEADVGINAGSSSSPPVAVAEL